MQNAQKIASKSVKSVKNRKKIKKNYCKKCATVVYYLCKRLRK